MNNYKSYFTMTVGGAEGHTTKTTALELSLMAHLAAGISPDLVMSIDGTNRLGVRLAKSEGGKRIAAGMTVIQPSPKREEGKDNPKLFLNHYNPVWASLKKSHVGLGDQGANVAEEFFEWWIDADLKARFERENKVAQFVVTCTPEAMPIKSALANATVISDCILPADGKLFVVFNEKDTPKGFRHHDGYQEYRQLSALCESGRATRIDVPSCRSDFFLWARSEDVAIMGLLERLGDRHGDVDAQRRFEGLCRKVGIDPDDEISIDDESNAFYDWLATASEGFKKVVHADLLAEVSKVGVPEKAAE